MRTPSRMNIPPSLLVRPAFPEHATIFQCRVEIHYNTKGSVRGYNPGRIIVKGGRRVTQFEDRPFLLSSTGWMKLRKRETREATTLTYVVRRRRRVGVSTSRRRRFFLEGVVCPEESEESAAFLSMKPQPYVIHGYRVTGPGNRIRLPRVTPSVSSSRMNKLIAPLECRRHSRP
jgi:hypothetical protein